MVGAAMTAIAAAAHVKAARLAATAEAAASAAAGAATAVEAAVIAAAAAVRPPNFRLLGTRTNARTILERHLCTRATLIHRRGPSFFACIRGCAVTFPGVAAT